MAGFGLHDGRVWSARWQGLVCTMAGFGLHDGSGYNVCKSTVHDGSGYKECKRAWLRQDTSWVVNSTGTPWVINGVTHDAAKALDGDTNTYWNVMDTWRNYNNWYIVLDIAAPLNLTRIAVNCNGDTNHDIAAFKLQSSQVGSPYSWEDVVSVDNVQGGTDQRQEFGGFQGTARYWRFVVTRTHGGWQPYLTELNLYSISPDCERQSIGKNSVVDGKKSSWAFNDSATYNGAVSRCSLDGGTLAIPRDNTTNEFLIDLKNGVDNNAFFRFGLTDVHQEGVLMWVDNVPLGDFRPWGPEEPNNNGNEDCAEYFPESHSKKNTWNDGPCTKADRKFICQLSQLACPIAGYVGFDGVCYKSFTEKTTRDEARQACAADGGILAMPKDSATNTFLANLAEVVWGRWLGLTVHGGQWVFEDGQNLTSSGYSNWLPGEPQPDNGNGGCVGFWLDGSFWDEKDCSYLRGFICQLQLQGFSGTNFWLILH
ncbi:hypothetical protein Bbelb_314310 [Branchiostoma belcheri]|nr:hypothetical protein Bbelb_314310 [Branchiostoma belcheri]